MKYAVDKQERFAILKPDEPSVNAELAPQLRSELYILHNEGVKNLILDLSAVDFIDSSGLSAILISFKFCQRSPEWRPHEKERMP